MAIDRVALLRNAEKFLRQGKLEQAIVEYRRLVDDQPRDWNTVNLLGDLYLRAGHIDKAADEYTRIADHFSREGFFSKAGALYKKVLKARPHDEHALLQAAEMSIEQGLLVDARAFFTTVSDQRERRDDFDGVAAVRRRLAVIDPGVALEVAESAALRKDWAAAADILQVCLQRSPGHIAVLMRLVEVSVDGGLYDVAAAAQAQLADAYLAAGSALEARFIAEDLVARHPDDPSHIDRLRHVLTALGEPDPEAAIAARISGLEPVDVDAHDEKPAVAQPPSVVKPTAARVAQPPSVETSVQSAAEPPRRAEINNEVDLSVALEGFKAAAVIPAAPAPVAVSKDLDDVFAEMRKEATDRLSANDPDQELVAGLTLLRAGQLDLAQPHLEAASRALSTRFAAAAALGRIFLQRGDGWHAVEWLERAAAAHPPTPAEGHRLLYELADALENVGELSRALAICLELQAEAGEYEDVAERVDRLSRVQARG